MARKYTEEQLLSLDKEMLVTLFLGMQDQLEQVNENLRLLMEQVAVMNQRAFGRSSEKNLVAEDHSQAQLIEINGEMVVVFNEAESECDDLFNEPKEEVILESNEKKKKSSGKREVDLKGLPVVVETHELSDSQLKAVFGDMKYYDCYIHDLMAYSEQEQILSDEGYGIIQEKYNDEIDAFLKSLGEDA